MFGWLLLLRVNLDLVTISSSSLPWNVLGPSERAIVFTAGQLC